MRLLESQRGDSCRGSGYPELLGPGRRTCSLPKGAGAALLLLLSLSVMSTLATPWTVAQQAPLPMGFSRQEYWQGLPCLPSRGSYQPRDQTHISYVSCIGRLVLYH